MLEYFPPRLCVDNRGIACSCRIGWVHSSGTACSASQSVCTTAKLFASFSVLGINVSAQAIQVGSRALIVDHCPSHLQPQVNAWVSRICNTASIFLYLASSSDLPHLVPFLGDTRLKALALLGSFTLLITSSITCLGISNTDSTINETKRERLDHYRVFNKFRTVATKLPTQINRIHLVQFFSWFAWYPFMVYISK